MLRFASLPVLIVAGFCASHGFESRGFRFPRRGSIQIHELADETILSWCVFVLCLILFRSAVFPCFFRCRVVHPQMCTVGGKCFVLILVTTVS